MDITQKNNVPNDSWAADWEPQVHFGPIGERQQWHWLEKASRTVLLIYWEQIKCDLYLSTAVYSDGIMWNKKNIVYPLEENKEK